MKLKEKWAIESLACAPDFAGVDLQHLKIWQMGFDYCKKAAAIEHLYPKILSFGESDAGPKPSKPEST